MSHPEYLFSGFDLCVDGNGNLSHLILELDSRADFLEQKQIGRMFLTFKPSISLPEAEELAESLLERFLYRPSRRRRDFVGTKAASAVVKLYVGFGARLNEHCAELRCISPLNYALAAGRAFGGHQFKFLRDRDGGICDQSHARC